MKTTANAIAAITLTLITTLSCKPTRHTITMTPNKSEITRTLRTTTQPSPQQSEQYSTSTTEKIDDQTIHTLSGQFKIELPKDVGQKGYYLYYETTMGSTYIYSERFGQNDDMLTQITEQQKAVDKLVDHLINWLSQELSSQPNFRVLKNFLNKNVRHDAKNLAIWILPNMIAQLNQNEAEDIDDENYNYEIFFRIYQYLTEREYFDTADLPKIIVSLKDEDYLYVSRYIIAQKLGIAPSSLTFLTNEKSAEDSLNKYLTKTSEYKTRMKNWKKEQKKNPKAPKPDPSEIMSQLTEQIFMINLDLFGTTPELELNLVCTTQPISTNGHWDSETKTITWSRKLHENLIRLPIYAYAIWSTPNEKFQKEHFSDIILTGEDLVTYCLWQNSLTDSQKQTWQEELKTIKTQAELITKLKEKNITIKPTTKPSK